MEDSGLIAGVTHEQRAGESSPWCRTMKRPELVHESGIETIVRLPPTYVLRSEHVSLAVHEHDGPITVVIHPSTIGLGSFCFDCFSNISRYPCRVRWTKGPNPPGRSAAVIALFMQKIAAYEPGLARLIYQLTAHDPEDTVVGSAAFRRWAGHSHGIRVGLTEVTLPDTVTSIGDSAFRECIGLAKVNLPDSITHIGESAFRDCVLLKEIKLPRRLAFIAAHAFRGCSVLEEVRLPDLVTHVGSNAFHLCQKLTMVELSPSIKRICNWTFTKCSALRVVHLPDTLHTIESWAFSECTSLQAETDGDVLNVVGFEFFSVHDTTQVEATKCASARIRIRVHDHAFDRVPCITSTPLAHDISAK